MRTIKMFALSALLSLGIGLGSCATDENYKYGYLYNDLPFEMARVERPTIPADQVKLSDFGGKGDAVTKNSEAFSRAIEHLSSRGGGRLVVESGVWYTGPITLKSNIELHLEEGAVIIFSGDVNDYPLIDTSFEGLETKRCISPISADGAKNIAITGRGTIDGSGDAWRSVKKNKMTSSQWSKLIASGGILNEKKDGWFPSESAYKGSLLSDMNVPLGITSDAQWEEIKQYLRPVMVSLKNCENVLLEGVNFQNSPSWNIHPLMCKNLIVDNVSIRNPWYAQNGDGIDIESCTNVIMVNSTLDVGDDGICIKSGKDENGRRRAMPTQNVIVDNCVVYHGHGGFVVGSEMSGGVRNIAVTNCQFLGTDVGLRFKSTRGRGGVVENIHISNINMINIPTEPLLFDLYYGGKSASESFADGDQPGARDMHAVDETTPRFKDIHIRDVFCRGARRAMFFNGLPEMNVENVTLENCFIYSTIGAQLNNSTKVRMKNVGVYNTQGPALIMSDVSNIEIDGFHTNEGKSEAMTVSGSVNRNISVKSDDINSANASIVKSALEEVKIK